MEKEKLKKEIDGLVDSIVESCDGVKGIKEKIDKLLSLQGQYDVQPALVNIPLTGREETIDTGGSYTITRNDFATVFHSNGYNFIARKDGYDVSFKNHLKSAHVPFDKLFELYQKKQEGKLTKEEQEAYDILIVAVVNMCQIVNIASTSEHRQATLVLLVEEWFEELSKELQSDLQEETPAKDAEFERSLEIAEE